MESKETEAKAAASGGDVSKNKATMKKLFSKTALGATFEEVPDSVLDAEDVNLSVWAVLATDQSLKTAAALHTERTTVRLRRESVMKMASEAPERGVSMTDLTKASIDKKRTRKGPITAIRINSADKITDAGIKAAADAVGSHLLHLELNKVTKVTDIGLRAVTLACSNLQTLHMDRLSQVQGPALASMAASCPSMTSLSLERCSQFAEWTYQAVSQGCPQLRFLNLNHCNKVTDEVLKAFARCCNHLRVIKLAGCKAISDVGLLQISNHCTGLEVLDLARSELAFKITDVALLALGERCHDLASLDIRGCYFITDVGMNWLSMGCTALTHLNIGGLFKLTDTALLDLSERCPLIRRLHMPGLKKLSDVGIRYLSQGCKFLEFMDLTGIFLLTDGQVRDFGLEGLQALCKEVSTLKNIRLAGCYNVGPASLAAFGGGCPNMTKLNLSLCPKIDARGLYPLMAGCTNLVDLCLRGCDGVDDDGLRAIAASATQLSTLNLANVELISDAGMASLVRGCRALRFLNLTNCTGVSDLTLLAIAEAKMNPGPRELILAGCFDCTDTGVSWLAERCPTLTALNLIGCSVSRPGIRAILHAWKHVLLRDDETWMGPAPAERAAELKFIEEYGEQWKAAQKMQTVLRGRIARKKAAKMREDNLMNWVATRLQTLWQRRQARRAYIIMLIKRRNEDEVATKIQTQFRMKMARRKAARVKEEAWVRKCHHCATLIQRIYRGKLARDMVNIARAARDEYFRKCLKAATDVQRAWRGRQGRVSFQLALAAKKLLQLKKEEASLLINRILRGKMGRMQARKQKQWWKDRRQKEEWAALLVQRHIRGLFGRRVLQRLQSDEDTRQQAALWIQSRWRARHGRLAAHLLKQARQAVREEQAAIMVQAQWRAKKGRFATFLLRRARQAHERAKEVSAVHIQRIIRGKIDRKRAKNVRAALTLKQLKLQDLVSWAAITVQKNWRAVLARRRVYELKMAHERRWKELWDEETQRPFFYDKNTGEIRWRRPQHLLNQLPKPFCENCEDVHAAFECKNCNEFFCETCWPQVHFGGKRRKHEFRPLYDRYAYRIDYGEGEWPSVWPSEIEQDEFVGWQIPDREGSGSHGWDATGGHMPHVDPQEINPMKTWGAPSSPKAKARMLADASTWGSSDGGGGGYDPVYSGQSVVEAGDAGWAKYWDESAGAEFFYNESTGETSWERPAFFVTPRYDGAAAAPVYAGQSAMEAGAAGWGKYWDESAGADFYYNESTGETSWERPLGFVTPRWTEGQEVLEENGGWSRLYDEDSESYFYRNDATGETTWDRPLEFSTPRADIAAANWDGLTSGLLPSTVVTWDEGKEEDVEEETEGKAVDAEAGVEEGKEREAEEPDEGVREGKEQEEEEAEVEVEGEREADDAVREGKEEE